jgi:hypothetical protein
MRRFSGTLSAGTSRADLSIKQHTARLRATPVATT